MVPCTFDQMAITHIHHKEDVMHPKELHDFSSQLEIHSFIILCCCLPAILLAMLTIVFSLFLFTTESEKNQATKLKVKILSTNER